jgi:hypothetical protein
MAAQAAHRQQKGTPASPLSEQESFNVLHRVILPAATQSAVAQARPVVVVVAGQPGVGKTEIAGGHRWRRPVVSRTYHDSRAKGMHPAPRLHVSDILEVTDPWDQSTTVATPSATASTMPR